MGGPQADTSAVHAQDYHQFVNPDKKWYKNRRLVTLNLWLLLLCVLFLFKKVLTSVFIEVLRYFMSLKINYFNNERL